MAEYAARYGGFPAPESPWPLFLAGARRASRFDARAKLMAWEAAEAAISSAFGGSDPKLGRARDRLLRLAYPVKRTAPIDFPLMVPDQEQPDGA